MDVTSPPPPMRASPRPARHVSCGRRPGRPAEPPAEAPAAGQAAAPRWTPPSTLKFALHAADVTARFEIHEPTSRVTVTMLDRNTGEVLREVPDRRVLDADRRPGGGDRHERGRDLVAGADEHQQRPHPARRSASAASGSGIDTASIVTPLMKLERAPIDRINADKATLNTKKGVVQEINSLLGKLRDAAAEMYKPNALAAKTATAADPPSSAPSATNAAAAGTYNVVVTSLAQAHTMASGAAPALTAGQTLEHHRRRHHGERGGAGRRRPPDVRRPDQRHHRRRRLRQRHQRPARADLQAERQRRAPSRSAAPRRPASAWPRRRPGTDAAATVNGLPVTSSGNVIEGAINGVSLSLTKIGSTTVTVGADTAAQPEEGAGASWTPTTALSPTSSGPPPTTPPPRRRARSRATRR